MLCEFPDNPRMSSFSPRPLALYLATFLTALLAAASAVYWVLGVADVAGQHTPRASILVGSVAPDTKDLARALGGDIAPQTKPVETTSSQYQLLGVVAGPVGKGIALMAIGNAPPKAYRVGSTLEGGQVLQSVSKRGALLGTTQLELPQLTNP